MTYRELLYKLGGFSTEQLDSEIMVEDAYTSPFDDHCLNGELRICGPEHFALEAGHPVIFIP